jgi:hypothetical protein
MTPESIKATLEKLREMYPDEADRIDYLEHYIKDLEDRLFTLEEMVAECNGWILS